MYHSIGVFTARARAHQVTTFLLRADVGLPRFDSSPTPSETRATPACQLNIEVPIVLSKIPQSRRTCLTQKVFTPQPPSATKLKFPAQAPPKAEAPILKRKQPDHVAPPSDEKDEVRPVAKKKETWARSQNFKKLALIREIRHSTATNGRHPIRMSLSEPLTGGCIPASAPRLTMMHCTPIHVFITRS